MNHNMQRRLAATECTRLGRRVGNSPALPTSEPDATNPITGASASRIDAPGLLGRTRLQDLLPNASADEVRRHVRRVLDVVGKDGGYILGGSHALQGDTPVENVTAMIEEGKITRGSA